jgi:hypothetical protein
VWLVLCVLTRGSHRRSSQSRSKTYLLHRGRRSPRMTKAIRSMAQSVLLFFTGVGVVHRSLGRVYYTVIVLWRKTVNAGRRVALAGCWIGYESTSSCSFDMSVVLLVGEGLHGEGFCVHHFFLFSSSSFLDGEILHRCWNRNIFNCHTLCLINCWGMGYCISSMVVCCKSVGVS